MIDYFHEKERAELLVLAAKRDKAFSPVIGLLARLRVTPNMISAAGVLFLLAACLPPPPWHRLVAACLVCYVLCDGLDGPLARRLGAAHAGGSLVDIIADQAGVAFLAAAAIVHLDALGPVMVLYSSSYLGFIALVCYANSLKVQLRRFFRTKYFFFGLYWLSLVLRLDLVTHFAAAFAAYYLLEILLTLRRIYAFHAGRRNNAL